MRIDAQLIDPFICTHVIVAFADNYENGTVFISNALGGNSSALSELIIKLINGLFVNSQNKKS